MYLRDAPTLTLADVHEQVESDPTVVVQALASEVQVDLDANEIRLSADIVLPANADGKKALGAFVDVPHQFLLRQDADVQQFILSTLLGRKGAAGAFVYNPDGGLREVRDPATRVIPVQRLIEVAERVITPEAPVIDFWSTADEFRLDVSVPAGFDRGWGGDRQVNDLAGAGVRLFQDRKHNLAPQVSPFSYRLICTNGMVTSDEGLKVDARGQSVEEVLAELELAADRAFRRAESDLAAFYSLRSERVANPERTLLRLGTEAGLPVRTITRLQERVPIMIQDNVANGGDETVSMFDLVNLITNQANDESIRGRSGARATLEAVGGNIVTEHADRCNACQSRLVH